ncbi:MAG: hypothetical protein K2X57_02030, partial [Xanthobacteraceae bacterium]|nr:hypothetical protein [Xanthobacteraceae bacterium]
AEDDSSNGAPKSAHKQSEGPRRYAYFLQGGQVFEVGGHSSCVGFFPPPAFLPGRLSRLEKFPFLGWNFVESLEWWA